jgi:Domain of unknown function (DUF4394)/PEP-CTERM motif
MKKRIMVLAASAMLSISGAANAASIIGITETNNLVTFDSSNPGSFTSSVAINGTSATFLAIDVRDSNGLLYGLGDDLAIYTINQFTGLATALGGPLAITGTNFGFDFNTVVDAIRIVSNNGSNYVANANTGTLNGTFTPVAFAAGDPNAGMTPVVTANGYIHGSASQFAISTGQDVLVTQANNLGTLNTVGSLGVAIGPRASFDVGFDRVGYLADVNRFYTVNLNTGAATFVGNLSAPVFGITALAPVPEPATWMMMILGFAGIGGMMRRRTRSQQGKLITA